MISVLVTFHNNSPAATKLLRTLSRTFGMLGTDDVEFLLIDDHSDGEHQIPQLMAGFRAGLPASVTVRPLATTSMLAWIDPSTVYE